jgi:catechol-2,3-dioxygenase
MESGSVERTRGLTRGFCELTLEARDPAALAEFYKRVFGWDEIPARPRLARLWRAVAARPRGVEHEGPVEHDGGDRSVYFEDPEGNVVEAWDFFEHGDGAEDGVEALR